MPRPYLTPRQRSELGKYANACRWAPLTAEQRRAQTQPARDANFRKYLDRCPPDPEIADPEQRELDRKARARQLMRADMSRMRVQAASKRAHGHGDAA